MVIYRTSSWAHNQFMTGGGRHLAVWVDLDYVLLIICFTNKTNRLVVRKIFRKQWLSPPIVVGVSCRYSLQFPSTNPMIEETRTHQPAAYPLSSVTVSSSFLPWGLLLIDFEVRLCEGKGSPNCGCSLRIIIQFLGLNMVKHGSAWLNIHVKPGWWF